MTSKKNSIWEKERRNRLCAAFANLAKVLPCTPKTTSKIMILERALQYIKELRQKNLEFQEAEKKHPGHIFSLLEKLSVLEERCSQLVQHIQQSGVSCTSSLFVNSKNITTPSLTTLATDTEVTNLNSKTQNGNQELISILPKKCNDDAEKGNKLNLNNDSSKPTPSLDTLHGNNVLLAANTNENPPVYVGNVGNMLFPMGAKTSPLIVSSDFQPSTLYLIQRPLIQHHQILLKDGIIENSSLPLAKNISVFDRNQSMINFNTTKTTMVNKQPIPAISSSSTLQTIQPQVTSVSHKMHRKLKKMLKTDRKSKISTVSGVKDKENVSKTALENKIDSSQTASELETGNKAKEISNDDISLLKNAKTDKIQCSDETASENTDQTQKKVMELNENINTNICSKNKELDKHPSESQEKEKSISNQNNSTDMLQKNLVETHTYSDDKRDTSNKAAEDQSIVKNVKSIENTERSEKLPNTSNTTAKIVEIGNDLHEQHISHEAQNVESNTQSSKTISAHASSNEIPEDLLASFVAPVEQNPSLLASSPLAASPTAAFLLTFPLVCPGPRPDTPNNDNLQTPNICSLDNFSTFFSSKDTAAANSLPIVHAQIFNECTSKTSIQNSPEKNKQNWLDLQTQNNNFAKPITEGSNGIKTEEFSGVTSNIKNSAEKLSLSTSSTCSYSQNTPANYNNCKIPNVVSNYSMSDNIFNYNHKQLDQKEALDQNRKSNFIFCNSMQTNVGKNKIDPNSSCPTSVPSYLENISRAITCSNTKPISYSSAVLSSTETSNCKRAQTNDGSIKLNLPNVGLQNPSVSKNIDIPSHSTQSKLMFSNAPNIYTSCNTYNPFSNDFPQSSMNLGISCGNTLNNSRPKPSSTYFPEITPYSQNGNFWSEENQNEYNINKLEHNKKLNLPLPFNQSLPHNISSESDARLSLSSTAKCSLNKQASIDNKSSKINKPIGKDSKYFNDKQKTSDFLQQKGPVNWMTSDVIAQQNNEIQFSTHKEIKSEQNFMISNSSQSCLDPALSGNPLNYKKSDIFEQPLFHVHSGYVPQVVSEENFTWSPSKLGTYSDNSLAVPCSLPTLVGDLALGISESKMSYQASALEQESGISKERKSMLKSSVPKPNGPNQSLELNPSLTGNYFSVSNLMDRGKIVENSNHNKACVQNNLKRSGSENETRIFGAHSNSNKTYSSANLSETVSNFPATNYATHQTDSNNLLNAPKNSNFNNKLEGNNKTINKNNYSTEALLQSDSNYANSRKMKHYPNAPKVYGETTAGYAIHNNQLIPTNHPLPFDNFSQNQQYGNNNFSYAASSMPMNSTFYTTSNFIPSTNMVSTNYVSNGCVGDLDVQNNGENGFYHQTKNEYSKYAYTQKMPASKDPIAKNKNDVIKKDALPNKRQKKSKNNFSNNYGASERCFSSVSNLGNSPATIPDESYYAYNSSGQIHQFPSQTGLLSSVQSAGAQQTQKVNFNIKPNTSSPNPVGTSLTNFNLSTIFPEIVKRPNMTGYPDGNLALGQPTKSSLPGVFHPHP